MTGFAAHEIVVDFIHNSYNHFSSGIFWVNCQLPEFITESVKNIEKVSGRYITSGTVIRFVKRIIRLFVNIHPSFFHAIHFWTGILWLHTVPNY